MNILGGLRTQVDGTLVAAVVPSMPQTLDGVHLLLVEDDMDARDVMKLVMEYQGALVVAVEDAKSALSIMTTIRPDVLVTDINMPEHDGVWLIEQARERGCLGTVPILAVTALDLAPHQIETSGFSAYLRKPVDPNTLCTTVQALARRRPPPGSQE
jgi:CheY-like chemotaxis protein